MTMTLDNQHQRFGSGPGSMHFEYSAPSSSAQQQLPPPPAFSNPWTSPASSQAAPAPSLPAAMYHGSHHHHHIGSLPMASKQQHPSQQQQQQQQQPVPQHPPHRSNTASSTSSLASYASSASNAPGSMLSSSYEPSPAPHHGMLGMPQDVLTMNRLPPPSAAFGDYSTTASPVSATYAASSGAPPFDHLQYAASALRDMADDRRSFAEAIDASQGMLAMSQETPRGNAYDARHRDSADSYGFPNAAGHATHSNSSSISSHTGGTFNSYYADSISEYSTAGSDIESVASRSSLGPRMPGSASMMASSVPPAPHTMMGQFSSKMAASVQKKHKCKICDKRFTRPSSLQTHMYSHTGEKPFACEFESCGRHFSVVSNLRRHMKVHKPDNRSGSEEHNSD